MTMLLEKPVSIRGGIHLPLNKSQSLQTPIQKVNIPPHLTIPLRQHIGVSATPIVSVGDHVLKGQEIACHQGLISAPIHASSSGVVSDIGTYPVPSVSGQGAPCIVIDTDGKDVCQSFKAMSGDLYEVSPVDIHERINAAGIVGLGGAGFPSSVKMISGLHYEIHLLIVNAAECEPFITCDEALLREKAREVILGTEIIRHAVQAGECVIGIEDNKPEAIAALQQEINDLGEASIELAVLPSIYPVGGEKQLVKALTGLEVPSQGLPLDLGIVCYNVGTVYAVYNAVTFGEPLVSRIVTMTGTAIKQPCNLEVLIGTPISNLIEECGGVTEDFDLLLMGGPMMGFPLQSDDLPVTKTTNCIIAATPADILTRRQSPMPCIRCGDCVTVCPVSLLPQQLYWFAQSEDHDRLKEYKLMDCIECGCCAYVCPSHLPLVQYYQAAKTNIWNVERQHLKSEKARNRFESREKRLNKEKQEHEIEQISATDKEQIKKEIEAAVERVKEKRKSGEMPSQDENGNTND